MEKPNIRTGLGYDVHCLVPNRPLTLGGITIPHTHGLLGHSDADVLIHAICDALLGAAVLGDIGRHFPDTSSEFLGIDSCILLHRVVALLKEKDMPLAMLMPSLLPKRQNSHHTSRP